MYLYEIHLHTSGCSACGSSTAEEMVDAAHAAGYAGIVFSNHFFHGNTAVSRDLPWRGFMEVYRQDYLAAKRYAEKYDMDVLFGIEEGMGNGKEVLIYGLTPEVLINCPDFLNFNLYEMSKFVRENGGIFACAHPFRNRSYIVDPDIPLDPAAFDFIEVHNHFNQQDENVRAAKLAKENGLPGIAGGDIHSASNLGTTGLAFYERVRTEQEFAEALRSRRYMLNIEGTLQNP